MAKLTEVLRRPSTLRRRLALSLSAVSILGTLIFCTLSYQAARQARLESIDTALCAAAEGVRNIVPPLILDQAEADPRDEPLYSETYRATHAALERYFAATGFEFLYAIGIRKDGTGFEIVSNLSEDQKKARMDPLKELLRKPYEPSPGMLATARSAKRGIDIAKDNYGYFRSCHVPVILAGGTVAILGADMEISEINARLLQDLLTLGGIGLLVLVVTLMIVSVISANVARDVGVAVDETRAVSRLDLKSGSARRHSAILEVDTLFGALSDMKDGLMAFSKYIPDSVIKRVLDTGRADIGGERRRLSLLMTDVTDFTTISEQLEPERVMTVMSEYFDQVVKPILQTQGTLDKYVGDAIFAYWNAPMLQPNHAELCCAAALNARAASVDLAARWKRDGLWPWHTRFGLHAGDVVFGNVGAPDRMDFTVIGSSVNIASRIEGLNKYYGTEILASDSLRELALAKFVFRAVDLVLPKGAKVPFEIFELLGSRAVHDADPAARKNLVVWEGAYFLYRSRAWREAEAAFEIVTKARPDDALARLYRDRCRKFAAEPPPADWDGVERFQAK